MTRVLPLVLALSFVGCGHSPTAPGPSAVTVTAADDLVFIGADLPLTATADGRDVTSSSAWSVEGTAFHVTSLGVAHADHSGMAQIDAKYQGILGRVALRALPNMQGHFVGQYVVDTCSETGNDTGTSFCAAPQGAPPGSAWPFRVDFTQTRDSISGTISVGAIVSLPFTTSLSASGQLGIELSGSDPDSGTSLHETFSLSSETPARIDGTMTLTIANDGASWGITAHLANVVRQ